jgi:hypothetical protein
VRPVPRTRYRWQNLARRRAAKFFEKGLDAGGGRDTVCPRIYFSNGYTALDAQPIGIFNAQPNGDA